MRPLPPVLEVFVRPETRRPDPPPVEVDMRRVILVGLAVWAALLAVAAVLWRLDVVGTTPLWTCAAGIVLGLLGLVWDLGHRRR